MRKLIKGRQIVNDDWSLLKLADGESDATAPIPSGPVLVPLRVWITRRAELALRSDVGVWIASDERPESLAGDISRLPVIAVDFPKFSDGRGYSIAWNLRTRLGYKGELRAIGDVLRDQLFFMQRVGFDAFATRADRSIEDALKGLTDFSETYQASWDEKMPLFRRIERGTGAIEQ